MKEFEHGGNVYNASREAGCEVDEIIDLSSNVSPYIHKNILKKLDSVKPMLSRLPEPHSENLVGEIVKTFDLNEGDVLAGNGSTEIIQNICKLYKGKKAVIVQPTYVDYEKYAKEAEMRIANVFMSENNGFAFDDADLLGELSNASVCFICNPNNPTGFLACKDEVRFLADMFKKTLFVVDESYIEFNIDCNPSLMGCSLNNIAVLRSFSKAYGVPALRAGYIFSRNQLLIEEIKKEMSPWGVNTLAQELCLEAFRSDIVSDLKKLQKTKELTIELLSEIKNLKIFNGSANFLLIKLKKSKSADFYNYMLSHKILIRDCSNIKGLSDKFIRIAIKSEEEMLLFCKLAKVYFDIF